MTKRLVIVRAFSDVSQRDSSTINKVLTNTLLSDINSSGIVQVIFVRSLEELVDTVRLFNRRSLFCSYEFEQDSSPINWVTDLNEAKKFISG